MLDGRLHCGSCAEAAREEAQRHHERTVERLHAEMARIAQSWTGTRELDVEAFDKGVAVRGWVIGGFAESPVVLLPDGTVVGTTLNKWVRNTPTGWWQKLWGARPPFRSELVVERRIAVADFYDMQFFERILENARALDAIQPECRDRT